MLFLTALFQSLNNDVMENKKILLLKLMFLLIFTSCKNDIDVDLGGEYKLINSASFNDLTIVTNQNIVIVKGHILNYTFDSTFIVVCQRPRDSVKECTGTIPNMTKNKCDEAFDKSTFRQYWIINKKAKREYKLDTLLNIAVYSNVYGPLKKKEYLKKRDFLGLNKNLQLKEE